ncbi:hypothetical protein PVK06_033023 [Gossypium arboreum]|uniref:Uncharacterized protein n=1 Tax=Gossypium arboreum TaxID=29729 RepID=A0ABR0NA73_GOSAR|nr:hypothetical protein PVK06_033023 [Gossypium arboreum]
MNRVPSGAKAVADEERRWTELLREMRGWIVEEEMGSSVVTFKRGIFVGLQMGSKVLELSRIFVCRVFDGLG